MKHSGINYQKNFLCLNTKIGQNWPSIGKFLNVNEEVQTVPLTDLIHLSVNLSFFPEECKNAILKVLLQNKCLDVQVPAIRQSEKKAWRCFLNRVFIKRLEDFTVKHLCQILLILKRNSNTSVFLGIFQIFQKRLFHKKNSR